MLKITKIKGFQREPVWCLVTEGHRWPGPLLLSAQLHLRTQVRQALLAAERSAERSGLCTQAGKSTELMDEPPSAMLVLGLGLSVFFFISKFLATFSGGI